MTDFICSWYVVQHEQWLLDPLLLFIDYWAIMQYGKRLLDGRRLLISWSMLSLTYFIRCLRPMEDSIDSTSFKLIQKRSLLKAEPIPAQTKISETSSLTLTFAAHPLTEAKFTSYLQCRVKRGAIKPPTSSKLPSTPISTSTSTLVSNPPT